VRHRYKGRDFPSCVIISENQRATERGIKERRAAQHKRHMLNVWLYELYLKMESKKTKNVALSELASYIQSDPDVIEKFGLDRRSLSRRPCLRPSSRPPPFLLLPRCALLSPLFPAHPSSTHAHLPSSRVMRTIRCPRKHSKTPEQPTPSAGCGPRLQRGVPHPNLPPYHPRACRPCGLHAALAVRD